MSNRPSTKCNKTCSSTNVNTAVIGDSAAATLYSKRLLNHGLSLPLNMITEGMDSTNIDGISDVKFIECHIRSILHFLKSEQFHYIPTGKNDSDCECDASEVPCVNIERIIKYYVGAGPLGDFISAYIVPRVGPWFSHSSDSYLTRFFERYTMRECLSTQEKLIVQQLKAIWGIPCTESVMVNKPSILGIHYIFARRGQCEHTRELFLNELGEVTNRSNTDLYTESGKLHFEAAAERGFYNVTGDNLDIQNFKLAFMTNPYSYLRIITEGGLCPKTMRLPTFYRAVYPIPMSTSSTSTNFCGNIDYCGLKGSLGDSVITHTTFSLHDLNNPKNNTLAWLGQAYTTKEDLSVICQNGLYAGEDKVLLIVEAVNTKNKRKVQYSASHKELQIYYNSPRIEYGFLLQFARIVADLILAHSGITVDPLTLIERSGVCSIDGACHENSFVMDYTHRESPMVTVLQMASNLYRSDIFPSTNSNC